MAEGSPTDPGALISSCKIMRLRSSVRLLNVRSSLISTYKKRQGQSECQHSSFPSYAFKQHFSFQDDLSHTGNSDTLDLVNTSSDCHLYIPGSVSGTTSHYAKVGGHVDHYLRSRPETTPVSTILLFHGYTDFSYGWRYCPHLTALGYQVIVPDMLGCAETDSPAELAEFAKRKLSTDMALLMDQIVPNEQVIIGGHDWGADLAYQQRTFKLGRQISTAIEQIQSKHVRTLLL